MRRPPLTRTGNRCAHRRLCNQVAGGVSTDEMTNTVAFLVGMLPHNTCAPFTVGAEGVPQRRQGLHRASLEQVRSVVALTTCTRGAGQHCCPTRIASGAVVSWLTVPGYRASSCGKAQSDGVNTVSAGALFSVSVRLATLTALVSVVSRDRYWPR